MAGSLSARLDPKEAACCAEASSTGQALVDADANYSAVTLPLLCCGAA
jgi:hypothetical protein